MTEDLLHETREGGIAWTTFNRPQARNAMTFAMYARLAELADEISADPAIRVWVIMGAGGKAFASGTDISQFREFRTAEDALNYEARIDKVLGALERCTKPVIAAITGACTGGGLGIAGCCDIRIADKGARFGLPIAKTLGNILNMHNFARFYALVGPAAVTEMIMTARLFSAEEAKHIGGASIGCSTTLACGCSNRAQSTRSLSGNCTGNTRWFVFGAAGYRITM